MKAVDCVGTGGHNDDACSTSLDSSAGYVGAGALAITPDGHWAYGAGYDVIAEFRRNRSDGTLSFIGCIQDEDAQVSEPLCDREAPSLESISALALSPDGASLYAASEADRSLARFHRDSEAGHLRFEDCIADDPGDRPTENCERTSPGLAVPTAIAITQDGTSVYLTAREDSAVVHLRRDPATGELRPAGCVDDPNDYESPPGSAPDDCSHTAPGLANAEDVAVSPDGTSLYAISPSDDAIVELSRDTATGDLTYQACLTRPSSFERACSETLSSFLNPTSVVVHPAQHSVYATSSYSGMLSHFSRDLETGRLAPQSCLAAVDGCGSRTLGLWRAEDVAISPDGRSGYVAAPGDSAVVHVALDPTTGAPTPEGCIDDKEELEESPWPDLRFDRCALHFPPLRDPHGVAVAPDGGTLYVEGGNLGIVALGTYPAGTGVSSGPPEPTDDVTPTFTLISSEAGSTFECSVDGSSFASCPATHTTAPLAEGTHRFETRATDPDGETDPSPRSIVFRIDTTPPETTIVQGPSGHTGNSEPSFRFVASERVSDFWCSLDERPVYHCGNGDEGHQTIGPLADGEHSFEVFATDLAGNTEPSPARRSFVVDTTVAAVTDTDPPQTTITRARKKRRGNRYALRFRFASDEAPAEFRCRFASRRWATCASPAKYRVRKPGRYRFWVRAIDVAGNADATPASRLIRIRRR